MKNRIRFSKERVSKAFNRGMYAKRMKKTGTILINNRAVATIDVDDQVLAKGLAESARDALDEIVRELDEALEEILNGKKKKEKDGENCVKCGTYYPQAEPNQPNGTLICYSCRNFG